MPTAGDVIVSKKIPGIVMWGVFKKAPPLPPSLAYIYSWPAEKSQMDPVVELDRENDRARRSAPCGSTPQLRELGR
jgi:hypothetical protein